MGEYREPTDKTVSEFLEEWLDYKRDFVRARSIEIYSQTIQKRIIPYIGKVKLRDLKPTHLRDLYSTLQRKQKLSARTVAQTHHMLHDALDRALKWEIVTRNVTDAVDPPRIAKKKFEIWTLDQVRNFLTHPSVLSHRFYVMFLLALTTGMRHGELLGLRWQDIDLDNGRLSVRHNLSWVGNEYVLGPPKSESGERDIIVPSAVIAALKAHKSRQNEDRLKMHNAYVNRDLVICRINGDFVSETYLRKTFIRLTEQAGLPRIRVHDLRHTHASLLLELGAQMKVIQEQLGHSTLSTTADVYTHLSNKVKGVPADLLHTALFDL